MPFLAIISGCSDEISIVWKCCNLGSDEISNVWKCGRQWSHPLDGPAIAKMGAL
jgi:hypothetical protein